MGAQGPPKGLEVGQNLGKHLPIPLPPNITLLATIVG